MALAICTTPAGIAWSAPGRRRAHCEPGLGRVTCIGGDKSAREAAARKALEQALGEKKEIFSKWDEEIQRRETRKGGSGNSGGGWKGFGGGRGGGGGGGGGVDPQDENAWNEAKQIVGACAGLAAFYLAVTNGKQTFAFIINLPKYLAIGGVKALAFIINSPLFVLRGFKRLPKLVMAAVAAAAGGDQGKAGEDEQDNKDTAASQLQAGSAQAHVISKWGRN